MPEKENPKLTKNSEKESPKPNNFTPEEEKKIWYDELLLEADLMKKTCRTTEEKIEWANKYGGLFRKIVKDPDIIKMIKEDQKKALEEIERRLYKNN